MMRCVNKWRRAIPIYVCLAVLFLTASALQGQQAAIHGTVVDSRGQAVRGASVAVRSASKEVAGRTSSDANGEFSVGGLNAGTYTVEATAAGFAPGSRRNVVAGNGTIPSISISLAIASVAEEVTVQADGAGHVQR